MFTSGKTCLNSSFVSDYFVHRIVQKDDGKLVEKKGKSKQDLEEKFTEMQLEVGLHLELRLSKKIMS